jgi:CRISPR-associated endoribonuclease Cas6/Csy4 subtype I-F
MQILQYLDIRVNQGRTAAEYTSHGAMNMRELMAVLHGVFRDHPSQFAVAYPEMKIGPLRQLGGLVRIFAEDPADLLSLSHLLDRHDLLDFKVKVKPGIQKVPTDYSGPWLEYRRIRVPNKRSRLEECRKWRMKYVHNLPYFDIHSQSTNQYFTVFIEQLDGLQCNDAYPDSYGLSVRSRPFAVPAV